MAEDCVDQAATLAQLPDARCVTHHLKIHGFYADPKRLGDLSAYGSDAAEITQIIQGDPKLGRKLHSALPYTGAEVIWAVRNEMARTIEDVLARRMRALFLNARAAIEIAPTVAGLMAAGLGWDEREQEKQLTAFLGIARKYVLVN
jgi:glycerol-3-phosphate dehydrogenase